MTQEEKAKAYDEALERAREWYNNPNSSSIGKAYLYVVFPELRQNKDERTRKDIIHFVQSRLAGFPECERFVTWLEKQGEQKSIDDLTQQEAMDIAVAKCFEQNPAKVEPFRIKKGEWYVCIHDFCSKAIRVGEIIQAEHDNSIRGFDFLYMENKYFRPAFENEIPQKPKWCEKDEGMMNHCIGAIHIAGCHVTNSYTEKDKKAMKDWLKTLKQRML